MSKENRWWLIVFLIGAAMLLSRATFLTPDGIGKAYVKVVPVLATDEAPEGRWQKHENSSFTAYQAAVAADPNQNAIQFSFTRTLGIWVAALFTLFVLSFLVKDNPFYKIAESVFIGVSAAYWMVSAFWDTLIPNLIGKLLPDLVRNIFMPGLGADEHVEFAYLIPLVLGVMLLWRLMPVGGWISRWPMAFFIGTFCGLRLVRFLQADFLIQVEPSVVSLWAENENGEFDIWESLKAFILFIGVMSCLVYFFFSFEHKGVVGRVARVGIWFLMITFGAAFGYTVMGRIALLAARIEFLFDDWLWLIDPTGKRVVEAAEVATNILFPMCLIC